jgi:LPS export ABC transporter protein LptC
MSSFNHIFKTTITAIAVICFFACEDNLKEIEKMNAVSNEPIGEVENMLLKHTDSGHLKIVMRGKLMRDFTNDAFPYMVFPQGVEVEVHEQQADSSAVTTITADYGVMYQETDLVDLQGNVRIVSHDGNTFNGDQLYWDQNAEWIFTDQSFTTNLPETGRTSGDILDSNESLNKALVRNSSDVYYVQPSEQ